MGVWAELWGRSRYTEVLAPFLWDEPHGPKATHAPGNSRVRHWAEITCLLGP